MIIKTINPSFRELLYFRKLARDCRSRLIFLEKIKLNLAFSVVALFFTRFLFNKFYVAEEENKILGFGITRANIIRGLFVAPKSQGKGLGVAILTHIEKQLRLKYEFVCLRSVLSTTEFYKKMGFTRRGRLMEKRL